MNLPLQTSKEEMKALIQAEFAAATYIPLQEALAPYLIEPFSRMLVWPYAKLPTTFPYWIIADFAPHRPGLTLAYSTHGHGTRGDSWGIVRDSEDSCGGDDSWFICLEDAFINSGMCTQPLPPNYEIR